jgi:hypothetical protein
MDIENDQIINSAEADAAVDTTYVVFNDDVGGRHPWEVLNTQRSEVKTPYCKVVVYERPF